MSTQDGSSEDASTGATDLLRQATDRGILESPDGLRQLVSAACACARLVVQPDIRTHPRCIRGDDFLPTIRPWAHNAIAAAEQWNDSHFASVAPMYEESESLVQKLEALRTEWKKLQAEGNWRPCAKYAVEAADAAAESAVAAAKALSAWPEGIESQAAAKCLESAVRAAQAAGKAWEDSANSQEGYRECAKAVRTHVKLHSESGSAATF